MSDPVLARLTGGLTVRSALAVVAHPDDESFGLGGVLRWLAGVGVQTRVLCLSHGEASTLGDAEHLAATASPATPITVLRRRRPSASARRRGPPVIEWGVAGEVAEALNAEFGTAFTGIAGADIVVDRSVQWRAIECHGSQLAGNAVVVRRLALQGERDRVRGVRPDGRDVNVATAEST